MKQVLTTSLILLFCLQVNAKDINNLQKTDSIHSQKSTPIAIENNEWTKRMALKIDLPKLITGSVALSFEYSLNTRFSIELGSGYIYKQHPYSFAGSYGKINGYTMRGGVKFSIASNNYLQKEGDIHILHGLYLMPELMYSDYTIINGYNKTGTYDYETLAITLNLGGQYVIHNIIVLDWYIGIGTGGISTQPSYSNYYFTHIGTEIPLPFSGGATKIPVAFTGGFKIGILF